jgi:hypothetical protein
LSRSSPMNRVRVMADDMPAQRKVGCLCLWPGATNSVTPIHDVCRLGPVVLISGQVIAMPARTTGAPVFNPMSSCAARVPD